MHPETLEADFLELIVRSGPFEINSEGVEAHPPSPSARAINPKILIINNSNSNGIGIQPIPT
jgi:hypothetical protein